MNVVPNVVEFAAYLLNFMSTKPLPPCKFYESVVPLLFSLEERLLATPPLMWCYLICEPLVTDSFELAVYWRVLGSTLPVPTISSYSGLW